MIESKLEELIQLKSRATALRNRQKFDNALELLDKVIAGLEGLRDTDDLDAEHAGRIRAEIADAFGMKGGVLRRQGKREEALSEYEKGRAIEELAQDDTYNLTNVISLSIALRKASPTDPAMQQKLKAAIDHLERKTAGGRTDEWWAWSDLGQYYLLLGDPDKARRCYERGRGTGVREEEAERHAEILRELAVATEETAPEISKGLARQATALTKQGPSPA